jgi:hypothetical protein
VKTFSADSDVSINVLFTQDGEPVVPDNGLITWELRGQSGEVLVPFTSMSDITDTQAQIPVQANRHAIAGGRTFEKRTLTVRGSANNFPFEFRVAYTIVPFINMTATPEDVRTFIGIDSGELPDHDIDMLSAYVDVLQKVDPTVMATALAAGDENELSANRAIVAQAVLATLPALPAKVSKAVTDGGTDIERFDYNFDKLRADASLMLEKAVTILTTRISASRLMSAFGVRSDPVTGA